MKYTVILQRESDGGYVAVVPALPGCVSQGDTRAEVLKNIKEAIELYLEDVREADEPLPVEADCDYVEVTMPSPRREFRRGLAQASLRRRAPC